MKNLFDGENPGHYQHRGRRFVFREMQGPEFPILGPVLSCTSVTWYLNMHRGAVALVSPSRPPGDFIMQAGD